MLVYGTCSAPILFAIVVLVCLKLDDYFQEQKRKKMEKEMREEKEKRMEDIIILSERFFNTSSHSLSRFFKD